MQVSPLTSPSVVPVYILTPKAQKSVHANVQASFTLLQRGARPCSMSIEIKREEVKANVVFYPARHRCPVIVLTLAN